MMNYRQWLADAIKRLAQSASPRRDAEILLEHVCQKTRTWILAFDETELTTQECEALETLLARREMGEPVAYLVGMREFWSLPLFVSQATLIPRPDTECLVERALERLPARACRVLDLGTGTGAIALALASERPDCEVVAVDFIAGAVTLAQRNAANLSLGNVTITQSNWFSDLEGQTFFVIVSNPPYIDEQDPHLDEGDVRFEPKSALISGNEGLADLAHIIHEGRRFLMPGGWMIVEHGWKQGKAVRTLYSDAGFSAVETCRDYGGNERLTLGRWHADCESI